MLRPSQLLRSPAGCCMPQLKAVMSKKIVKSSFYSVNDTCNLNFKYCVGGNFKILTGRVINDNIHFKQNDVSLLLYEYDQRTKQLQLLEKQNSGIEGVFRFLLTRGNQYLLKAVPKKLIIRESKLFWKTHCIGTGLKLFLSRVILFEISTFLFNH